MDYFDGDWYAPNDFDIKMDELKQSIKENTKQELKDYIKSLEKENAKI